MDYDIFLENLRHNSEIKAAIVVGSQARTNNPADEYSDIDMVLVAANPNHLLLSDRWLKGAGDFHISFVEDTLLGGKERRVLFDDGSDADFILLSVAQADALQSHEADDLFVRGYKVIKDEIDISATLEHLNLTKNVFIPPTEGELQNTVHDFWFHCVWTAKKLLRGELYTAKFCLDVYMKGLVLQMIELHSHLLKGVVDTWYNGRFMEKWADLRIIDKLGFTYAKYNSKSMVDALFETMDLFKSLAVDIAQNQSFRYDRDAESRAYGIVNRLFRSSRLAKTLSEGKNDESGRQD